MFANCAVQEASKPEKQEGNYNEGGSKVGDQAGKSVQEAAPSTWYDCSLRSYTQENAFRCALKFQSDCSIVWCRCLSRDINITIFVSRNISLYYEAVKAPSSWSIDNVQLRFYLLKERRYLDFCIFGLIAPKENPFRLLTKTRLMCFILRRDVLLF